MHDVRGGLVKIAAAQAPLQDSSRTQIGCKALATQALLTPFYMAHPVLKNAKIIL
jgi:hypothetical protein